MACPYQPKSERAELELNLNWSGKQSLRKALPRWQACPTHVVIVGVFVYCWWWCCCFVVVILGRQATDVDGNALLLKGMMEKRSQHKKFGTYVNLFVPPPPPPRYFPLSLVSAHAASVLCVTLLRFSALIGAIRWRWRDRPQNWVLSFFSSFFWFLLKIQIQLA